MKSLFTQTDRVGIEHCFTRATTRGAPSLRTIFAALAFLLATGAVQNAQAQNTEYDVYLLNRGGQNNHFYKNGQKVMITTSSYPAVRDIKVVGDDVYVLYCNLDGSSLTYENSYFLWKNGTATPINNPFIYQLDAYEMEGIATHVSRMFVDTNGDIYFSGTESGEYRVEDGSYMQYGSFAKFWKNNVPVLLTYFDTYEDINVPYRVNAMGEIFVENGSVLINYEQYYSTFSSSGLYFLDGVPNFDCVGDKFVLHGGNVYGLYFYNHYNQEDKRWGYSVNPSTEQCTPIILHAPNMEYSECSVRDIFVDNTGVYVAGMLRDVNNEITPVYWKHSEMVIEKVILPIPNEPANPSVQMKNVVPYNIYVVDGNVYVFGTGISYTPYYQMQSILWTNGVPAVMADFTPPSYGNSHLIVVPKSLSAIETVQSEKLQITVADNELRIENYAGGDVAIYDIAGRTVGARRALPLQTNGTQTINISHLPAGVYIVKVGNKTAKFVK